MPSPAPRPVPRWTIDDVETRDDELVAAADAYMRAHLDEPLTLREIARAIGCSTRVLLARFTGLVGIPPMRYFKRQRLAAVRAALRRRDAEHVADVAARWGFYHMGHFGADYRRLFGTSPSETLAEGRSLAERRGPASPQLSGPIRVPTNRPATGRPW